MFDARVCSPCVYIQAHGGKRRAFGAGDWRVPSVCARLRAPQALWNERTTLLLLLCCSSINAVVSYSCIIRSRTEWSTGTLHPAVGTTSSLLSWMVVTMIERPHRCDRGAKPNYILGRAQRASGSHTPPNPQARVLAATTASHRSVLASQCSRERLPGWGLHRVYK